MAKDFRSDQDRFEQRRRKANHRQMRQARDNWRTLPTQEDNQYVDLINPSNLRRIAQRSA